MFRLFQFFLKFKKHDPCFFFFLIFQDFEDAFARLLRLGLNRTQEREIIHVMLHCCLNEKEYNPFYAFLAQKFCSFDRRFMVSFFFFKLWYPKKILATSDYYEYLMNNMNSTVHSALALACIHLISLFYESLILNIRSLICLLLYLKDFRIQGATPPLWSRNFNQQIGIFTKYHTYPCTCDRNLRIFILGWPSFDQLEIYTDTYYKCIKIVYSNVPIQ